MAHSYPPTENVSDGMYFPIPIPFDREYPEILNWWDPLTVSVTDDEEVVAGVEDGHGDEKLAKDGLDVSRRTFPMRNDNLNLNG